MSHRLTNWTFDDIVKFLKKHHFVYNYTSGSHYYLGSVGGVSRQVAIAFHGARTLKPRALKSIILQSGIPKEEWMRE
jgi:predicted RNA binding protein YcfA (HicA-like mRNA interferase family)